MGAWGPQSYHSDLCHDILDASGVKDDPTRAEAAANTAMELLSSADNTSDIEASLGVLVWCLKNGHFISPAYCMVGLSTINWLLTEPGLLVHWFDIPERRRALVIEKGMLHEAFDNNGTISVEPALLD